MCKNKLEPSRVKIKQPKASMMEKARLIIGSGLGVHAEYPRARKLSEVDITINKDRNLRPTYQMDIGHLADKKRILSKYGNHFSEVIFERVGEGLADLYTNTRDMQRNLKAIYSMLQKNGQLVYEGFCKSGKNIGIFDAGPIDIGLIRVVDNAYQSLINIQSTHNKQPRWQKDFKDRFESLYVFHKEQLTQAGFSDVRFQVSSYNGSPGRHITCSATKN